ncbi:glycoside hydrolase family 73 protein [Nocardia sp. CA-119907]|uniref:glycoside hydrolase family 73 protein n=1 Tax=Nocardia sp. CA-119907 TaxID=3239973 RepID=UPI003D991C18
MSTVAESSILAPESIPDPGVWPARKDVFAEDFDETYTYTGEYDHETDEHESPLTAVSPGRLIVPRHPLLQSHAGTPPDVLIEWNGMVQPSVVDVVVHLHGYSGHGAVMNIVEHKKPISGLDFADPDHPAAVGRTTPTVLILPRGHHQPKGRYENPARYTFPALLPPGALQQLIDDALARFAAATGAVVRRNRLILTAHSGGGAALMAILGHTDPDEVHIFDALYNDPKPLIDWVRRRMTAGTGALRIVYRPGEGTARHSERVAAVVRPACSPNYRVERTSLPHNDIPRRFGWQLLTDASADLRGLTRSRKAEQPCIPQEANETGRESDDFGAAQGAREGGCRCRKGPIEEKAAAARTPQPRRPARPQNDAMSSIRTPADANPMESVMSTYAESPIFASPESTPDPGTWPTREDVFAENTGDTEYVDETSWQSRLSDTEWMESHDSGESAEEVYADETFSGATKYDQEQADHEDFDVEAGDYENVDYEATDYEAADYETPDYEAADFEAADQGAIGYGEMDYEDVDAEDIEFQDAELEEAPPTDRAKGIVRRGTFTKCSGHEQPGARAMAAQWRRLTGRRAGTYNCRSTTFGTPSLHGEGRSIDLFALASDPVQRAQAEAYIGWLQDNAVALQVAYIIWNRQQWNWQLRHLGWRPYGGSNPHTNHIHVDLSWEGALTPSPLFDGPVPSMGSGGAPAPIPSPKPKPALPSRKAAPGPSPKRARGVPVHVVEFVRKYRPHAVANQARTRIPWLVILGQAAIESGWGRRACGNNFFGIKARTSVPVSQRRLCTTREVHKTPSVRYPEVISVTQRADGRYDYVVRDWFRAFDSPDRSFDEHARVLLKPRYAKAFAHTDPYAFAREVAAAGYATAPDYATALNGVMRLIERVSQQCNNVPAVASPTG